MAVPWSPSRLKRALDGRDRAELNTLARYLMPAALAGRAVLLARRPYLAGTCSNKEDDVQEVLVALFRDDARILRKFDPSLQRRPDAADERGLRRFVIGVTVNVLLRVYRGRRVQWEALGDDMAAVEGGAANTREWVQLTRAMDLERALGTLSASDRSLFALIYVEQAEQAECCARLEIEINAFQARKSRLLRRLRRVHESCGLADARGRAHG